MQSIIKNILTIRRNFKTDWPRPTSVMANITGRCNLRCEFCEKAAIGGQAEQAAELEFDDIKKLVELARRFDCPLFFSGGEPFLHSRIWDVLEFCRSKNRPISIVTNGTCFDGLDGDKLDLLADVVSIMSVSIDSADPAEHDRKRGKDGSFEKIMRFISQPARRCRIAINSLLGPDLAGATEMIDLAQQLGCSLNFQPIQFESNFPSSSAMESKAELRKAMGDNPSRKQQLQKLSKKASRCGVATNLPLIQQFFDLYCQFANLSDSKFFGDSLLGKFVCFAPLVQVTVDEDGMLCPCALLAGQRLAFEGDLYENWVSQALEYRRRWLAGERWKVCGSCSCHFAENFRSNIVTFPWENRQKIPWLLAYYVGRLYHKAGRKA